LGKYCRYGRRKKSGWEELLCDYLCENHISHAHQPCTFRLALDDGTPITYKPDMIAMGVIIEPHGTVDPGFIRKMRTFRRAYPKEKTLLVVRNDDIPSIPPDIYDQILPIEHYDLVEQFLRELHKGT
jgi:hypothetical protein